jgi:hypothetical protein
MRRLPKDAVVCIDESGRCLTMPYCGDMILLPGEAPSLEVGGFEDLSFNGSVDKCADCQVKPGRAHKPTCRGGLHHLPSIINQEDDFDV